jgi:hypothetical protein
MQASFFFFGSFARQGLFPDVVHPFFFIIFNIIAVLPRIQNNLYTRKYLNFVLLEFGSMITQIDLVS